MKEKLTWGIFEVCLWVVIGEIHNLHEGGESSDPGGEDPVVISICFSEIGAESLTRSLA